MTPLKSSRSHQLYVFVAVLVLLPLLAGIAFQKELYALYLMRFRGPELEREFGFTAGKVDVVTESGAQLGVFAVISLVPTGILAKAGFRTGDIPIGYKHDLAAEFYRDLMRVQGESRSRSGLLRQRTLRAVLSGAESELKQLVGNKGRLLSCLQ